MPLLLETPVKLRLPKAWVGSAVEEELKVALAYEDGGKAHEHRTWLKVQRQEDRMAASPGYRPHWFVAKHGRAALDAKVAGLDAEKNKIALFRDAHGMYTYSGLALQLAARYGEKVEYAYAAPTPRPMPYHREPFPSRWYQQEAEDALVAAGHAGVSLPTGAGKSLVIVKLLRRYGLPAVVLTPSLSIARQLTADLEAAFGSRWVGRFYGGKKEASKRFVVAVSKSLTSLDRGSAAAAVLAAKDVVICDEAHMTPAETLAKVVLGLLAGASYRFFVSGTMLRTDGKDLLLEGITGPVVTEVSLRQLVGEGFLAKPNFFQYQALSGSSYTGDPIKMNRVHLHQNEAVYRHAGALVTKAARAGRRPLVLLDEVSQFTALLPHLGVAVGFAHGGADAKQKKLLPAAYHKSDPGALVASFDAGDLPVLVGTQCIGIGTDIKTADFVVDIVGLASEIRLSQNVGRGTRVANGKQSFVYVDYNVADIPLLNRQGEKRRKIMDSIYGPVKMMRMV